MFPRMRRKKKTTLTLRKSGFYNFNLFCDQNQLVYELMLNACVEYFGEKTENSEIR